MVVLKNILRISGILIAVILFNLSGGYAQEKLSLNVDTACYPRVDDSANVLLEVYYTLPRSQLNFIKQEDKYTAAMEISLDLDTVEGDSVDQVSWVGKTSIANLKELERKEYKFFDTVPALISPGEYVLTLGIKDVNSGRNAKVRKNITVPDFTGPGLKISQIQLAYSLNPDTTGASSAKGGKIVIPNASGIFAPEDNFVFFYAEAHGFKFNPDSAGNFVVEVGATDKDGNRIVDFYSKTLPKPGSSAVLSNGVNAYTLGNGNYILNIKVTDLETGESVEAVKPFTIQHSEFYGISPLMRSLYEVHPEAMEIKDEQQAELVYNQIKYIASPEELKIYESLNLRGKNNFMKEFWEKKDPDKSNNINEFVLQHYARWDYANQSFANRSYQEGWLTDKGRIFIKYGPPADKELSGLQIDTQNYEIWSYYNIPGERGESIFVFTDPQGHGDYRLFHSNVKGEKRVQEWREKLQVSKTIR
ncbi:MAG: GWxTD domain-containing protein [candidate division Zixibacteria bacterium]|nr:GWxTD domain-containing protein [candidate division Zixibacteria bacterium]